MSRLDYFSSMCRFLLTLVGSIFVVVVFVVALAPFSSALIAGSVLWFQYGYTTIGKPLFYGGLAITIFGFCALVMRILYKFINEHNEIAISMMIIVLAIISNHSGSISGTVRHHVY